MDSQESIIQQFSGSPRGTAAQNSKIQAFRGPTARKTAAAWTQFQRSTTQKGSGGDRACPEAGRAEGGGNKTGPEASCVEGGGGDTGLKAVWASEEVQPAAGKVAAHAEPDMDEVVAWQLLDQTRQDQTRQDQTEWSPMGETKRLDETVLLNRQLMWRGVMLTGLSRTPS